MAARRYSTTTLPAILALRDQGLNWLEVAAQLNVCPNALRGAVSLLGIQGAKTAEVATYPVEQWVRRLARGDTAHDIAQSHGLSRMVVYGVLRHRGLPTTCRAAIKAQDAGRRFDLPDEETAGMASGRRSVAAKPGAHCAAAHT